MSLIEWIDLLNKQGCVCVICNKVPSTGRFVTDHEHVKGWKNLPPNERKKYVRGILCWYCNNKTLTKGITVEKLKNAIDYLNGYRSRRNNCST